MAPIAARHCLKRVDSYSVTKTLQGHVRVDLVNVWWVAGPKTFGGISDDPDYKRLTVVRDAVFDVGRSLAFLDRTRGIQSERPFADVKQTMRGTKISECSIKKWSLRKSRGGSARCVALVLLAAYFVTWDTVRECA